MASRLDLSEDGIRYNLNKLKKEGILNRVGSSNGGYWEIIKY